MNKSQGRKRITGADLATSVGAAAFPLLAPNGSAAAPSYSFSSDSSGFYRFSVNVIALAISASAQYTFAVASIGIAWGDDTFLARDLANKLALKNGANPQTFRIYSTTTGSKYTDLLADLTNFYIDITNTAGAIKIGTIANNQIQATAGSQSVPSYSCSSFSTTGFYFGATFIGMSVSAVAQILLQANRLFLKSTTTLAWDNADVFSSVSIALVFDASGILAIKNGTTPQSLRIYGTTTGPKYAELKHDGTDFLLDVTTTGFIKLGTVAANQIVLPVGVSGTFPTITVLGNTDTGLWFPSTTSMRISIDAATCITFSAPAATGGIAPNCGIVYATNARFVHGTVALATNATEGFLWVQSCAGPPTGVPATIPSGQVALVYDSTNNKFYIYSGGWKKAQVTAVDAIYA